MLGDEPVISYGVSETCSWHAEAKLPSDNAHVVIAQLQGEGEKRLEAFIFERLFAHSVTGLLGSQNIAFNWLFQFSAGDEPKYWFRLQTTKDDWNKADTSMLAYLSDRGCSVTKIHCDPGSRKFTACAWADPEWTSPIALGDYLDGLLGAGKRSGRPSDWSPDYRTQVDDLAALKKRTAALFHIGKSFSKEDLLQLSTARILINCYLAPWFRRQPMDLDACYVANDRLYMVEFKRKYPAADGTFGIDRRPHVALIDWTSESHATFVHIILVDPLAEKSESPLHLLQRGSTTRNHVVWLGFVLNSRSLLRLNPHKATGHDSGMGGGTREQLRIPLCTSKVIGSGAEPSGLAGFLSDPVQFQGAPAGIDDLRKKRDRAREEFRALKVVDRSR